MQRKNPDKAIRYLVAVCALASALAIFGCGGDGGDDDGTTSGQTPPPSNVSNSTSVSPTNVQALVGQQFTIPNGSIFDPSIGNNPVTFAFASPSTFSLSGVGSTASGDVAFGSCTLTIKQSSFSGQGLQVGKVIFFTTCTIQLTASNVTVGGAPVNGTLTLTLGGANGSSTSLALTVQVSILSNGALLINGTSTGIVIPLTTGTTGTGGTP